MFTPPIATKEKKDFELCPVGTHQARLIKIIDLGSQKSVFEGKEKVGRKIKFVWELPNEKRVFSADSGEQPFIVSKKYSWSFFGQSTLKAHLMSWLSCTEDSLNSFDLLEILGRPCLLSINHGKLANGDSFTGVGSVSPLMKGMTVPAQVNEYVTFSIDKFEKSIFDKLSDWDKKVIMESPEYKKVTSVSV